MIARVWTARAAASNALRYVSHLRDAVLPVVQKMPGYVGATLLERQDGDDIKIVVMTWWRSADDIRAFAGDDITRAVVTDEARALLAQFDREVQHFDVTLEDRPNDR
jgi:heme-degrading monooxygenase HmoA